MSRLVTNPFANMFDLSNIYLIGAGGGGNNPPGETSETENPDGTVSGGSNDYDLIIGGAITEIFGTAAEIDARDNLSPFIPDEGDEFIVVTFYYEQNIQAQFGYSGYILDDGTAWIDVDSDGTYESHLAALSDGVYVDLDFDGVFETKFLDFFF